MKQNLRKNQMSPKESTEIDRESKQENSVEESSRMAMKNYRLTLLQNPCTHGVPSSKISNGSNGKQVSLR